MKTKIIAITALIAFSFSGISQKKWTLKEAVSYALENNITIKQNALNVASLKEDVVGAKGSFLPNLNASSDANLNFGSTIDPVSNGRISATNFSSSYGMRSTITVFNGFRLLNSYKSAQLGVDKSQLDLQKIKDDVSLNVVNSYLNILFAKENLGVAKVQYEISKKQIEAAQSQVDAGARPRGDLLNARATNANDAQNVISQENILNLALLQLAQLLQVDPVNFDVAPLLTDTPLEALMFKSPIEVYKEAVTNRPEILAAKIGVNQADINIDVAKSGFMPTLTATASAGTNFSHRYTIFEGQSNDPFAMQLSDNFGYGVGLSLSIPIFNRFQNKVNVNKAIITKDRSALSLENAKLDLEQTIQRSFLDAKAALKSFQAAKISLEAQQEAFKNAQDRYTLGAMTLFDFDQVRNRLVAAESALIRSKYDYVFKSKVLQFYNGESIVD